jgi:hypothetical protein
MVMPPEPSQEIANELVEDPDDEGVVAPEAYAISSFGIDFDVEGLVRRLRKEEIFLPHFQRSYVWKQKEASQFIESLLLGLPVPGVFLAKERASPRLLIIDGQQRLKTLQYFCDGVFRPKKGEAKSTVFKLVEVQEQFKDRTYDSLEEEDRIRFDNAVIHATVIKQEAPAEEEDTSLFYIFGRLNSGGKRLNSQEIRTAIYHGRLDDLLGTLNEFPAWRTIFGAPSERLKDQELILRFLALYFDSEKYERPMENFLSKFSGRHQKGSEEFLAICTSVFQKTMTQALEAFGKRAFRPVRAINAAVFDAVSVALAKRLDKGPIADSTALTAAYNALFQDTRFLEVTSKATADETNVALRLLLAGEAFGSLK